MIVRTEAGATLLEQLGPEWLALTEGRPGGMVRSQREAQRVKRHVFRGRVWLRSQSGCPVREYPGVPGVASWADRAAGLRDALRERALRFLGDHRYR
ncbi:MAG: hypothetical protein ACYC5Q_12710 [Thermoleophilia bacterium]